MTARDRVADSSRLSESPLELLPAVVLLLVNPLLLFPFVVDLALTRWLTVAASLAIALIWSRRLRQRLAGSWHETWPLAALAALIGWHLARGAPAAEGSRWLVLLLLGALAYAYCRALSPAARGRSLELIVMAGGAVGLYAIIQALGWDPVSYPTESWMYRVVTTFGHRNFTAAFLLSAIFAGLARADEAPPGGGRRPSTFLVLAVLGLLATGARFPILAAAVALTAARTRSFRRALVVLVIIAAVAGAVLFTSGQGAAVVTRTETIALRAALYSSMPPLMLEHPLVGGGPGRFARGIPQLAGPNTPQHEAHLVFLHAHNLPAEVTIEYGLVGLALLAAFALPLYHRLLVRGPRSWSWLVWGHLCWLVINLYDVAFFSYAGWVGLWPMLAFIRSDLDLDTGATVVRPRWLAAVPVMVALAGTIVLVPMTWSSHLCYVAARTAAESPGTASELYRIAGMTWPLPLDERYRAASTTLDAGRVGAAIRQLAVVDAEAPAFGSVRHQLAMAYARVGLFDQAVAMIDRHLQAHPADGAALADRARLVDRASELP